MEEETGLSFRAEAASDLLMDKCKRAPKKAEVPQLSWKLAGRRPALAQKLCGFVRELLHPSEQTL